MYIVIFAVCFIELIDLVELMYYASLYMNNVHCTLYIILKYFDSIRICNLVYIHVFIYSRSLYN